MPTKSPDALLLTVSEESGGRKGKEELWLVRIERTSVVELRRFPVLTLISSFSFIAVSPPGKCDTMVPSAKAATGSRLPMFFVESSTPSLGASVEWSERDEVLPLE